MRFAVQVNGQEEVLENLAYCFQSDFTRIIKLGEVWFLQSSTFETCSAPKEVFPVADELFRFIRRVTGVWGGLFWPFELGYVQAFDSKGAPINRSVRGSQMIVVYSAKGLQELREPLGPQPLASVLVEAAMTNAKLQEVLTLIGDEGRIEWPDLYNILEFLGGEEVIVQKKWASRKEIRRCRQTANHYRHLGSPKKYLLPPNPPTKAEARTLVLTFLKKWILEQL